MLDRSRLLDYLLDIELRGMMTKRNMIVDYFSTLIDTIPNNYYLTLLKLFLEIIRN